MQHEEFKEKIIKEGKVRGLSLTKLKVLSTDPFLVGSEKDYENAKWAANLWEKMMSKRKKALHLRGFHYWIQSQGIPKPDGEKYAHGADPAKDWSFLLHAAQLARYLGIGTWQNLVDLKHPNPVDYDNYWVGSGLERTGEVDIQTELNGKLEGLVDEFLKELLHSAPRYHEDGYQMYHSEIWIEKQSMQQFIGPICKKYEATIQSLVGQASVEKVNMSYERCLRAANSGKKVRIWYISDNDRYGASMIPAVARKLEFLSMGKKTDIKLTRLALTDEQITRYNLPRAPKHGEAVVELDALEAIYPGELGKIIDDVLKPYCDEKRPKIVGEENRRIREEASQIIETLRAPLQKVFESISVSGLAGDMSLADTINPNFVIPKPEHSIDDNDIDWVYSSENDYWKQFEAYKEYRRKNKEVSLEEE